jgi:predicted phosphodiesterase
MSRKVLQFIVFLILILGTYSFFTLCYNKNLCLPLTTQISDTSVVQDSFATSPDSSPVYKIAFISDSHENSAIFSPLKKSLQIVNPDVVIHAGDLTDFGTTESLLDAKSDLDNLDIPYLVLPGDHDIAETSSTANFNKVFTLPSGFTLQYSKVLFIPNFYNFTPFSDLELESLLKKIPEADILVSSQPIFVEQDNIFFNKYMGSDNAFDNLTEKQVQNLKIYNQQRLTLLNEIRKSKSSKIIISGDHHRSSNFVDPVNPLIKYHIVGSLAKYIDFGNSKLLQTSLQSNRYSILEIYLNTDKSTYFKIKEIELK